MELGKYIHLFLGHNPIISALSTLGIKTQRDVVKIPKEQFASSRFYTYILIGERRQLF